MLIKLELKRSTGCNFYKNFYGISTRHYKNVIAQLGDLSVISDQLFIYISINVQRPIMFSLFGFVKDNIWFCEFSLKIY